MENAQTTSCDNSLETLDNKYKRTIDSESLVDPLTEVPVEIKLDDPTRITPAQKNEGFSKNELHPKIGKDLYALGKDTLSKKDTVAI